MKLPPKQERFCQEYIIDLNGARAAERAEYSEKTARVKASQLLAKVNIQKRIAELQKKRAERTQITQDHVLEELALIAFSDLADLLDIEEGGLIIAKRFKDMPAGRSRLLKAVKEDRIIRETPDGEQMVVHDKIRYEIWDKLKALEMLGKHLGMLGGIGEELAKVIYEISEKFMPKILNKKNEPE